MNGIIRARFLMVICVLWALPAATLAADGGRQPVSRRGAVVTVVNGSLRTWADMDKRPLNELKGQRKMRFNNEFDRGLQLLKRHGTYDGAVQKAYPAGPARMPVPLDTFAGMNLNANGAGWPPDTTGDVGLDYYVQAVNTSIGIYSKATGDLVGATPFDSFFEGAAVSGTPCDSNNNGDPLVLFDRYAQRWFVLDFAWDPSETDGSYFSIAVSQTSDPTGAWWQYAFRADDTLMADYPKVGVWHDGIYITANMFAFSGGFQGVKIWALKTPDIYSGTLEAQSVTDSTALAWSLLPATARSATPPPTDEAEYLFALDADDWGGINDALVCWQYAVDWSDSANTTWSGPVRIPTASFALSSTQIPQPDTNNTLDSMYSRLMYPATYMNYGSHQAVFLCHTVYVNNYQCPRWYEVRVNGGIGSIYQQGTYAPGTNHRWMGSIAADGYGGIALGYSAGSDNLYPSIEYAGRIVFDTDGELLQGENILFSGSGSQKFYDRWGDYTTMSLDPTDDTTFWYTNEYYAATGTNWQTRIGSFRLPGNGDLDLNGVRNMTDVDLLLAYLSGNADSIPGGVAAADLTGDYIIDAADLAFLLNVVSPPGG